MIPQALAKHAVNSFVGDAQETSTARDRQEIIEIQQYHQTPKKHWWNKQQNDTMLSPEERKLLKKVKSRANFLDQGLSCCCCQIGFDGIIGLVPVIGDFISLLLAVKLVHTCMEASIPDELVSRMMLNIAIDFTVGLVPFLGDFLDILFKCNTRNALLFEHYLYKRRDVYLREEQGKMPLLSNDRESTTNEPPVMEL